MRSTFLLLVVLALLPGCAMHGARVDTGGMTAYDGVSADFPGDAQALAASAAEEMAHRYPPARTTLALVKTNSTFGQDLESALREQGFPIAAPDASGVRVAYTLDVIRDETPSNCYLRVQTSDGTAFGTLRVLTGEPRRLAREVTPSERMASASASAPEPRSLHDVPPAIAPAPQPKPVMPSKIERKTRIVHRKSTAARLAKYYKISVDEFCRLNNVSPDTDIPAGRRVVIHEPVMGKQPYAMSQPAEVHPVPGSALPSASVTPVSRLIADGQKSVTPTTQPAPAPSASPTPAPVSQPAPAPAVQPTPAPAARPTPAPSAPPTSAPLPTPVAQPAPAPAAQPEPPQAAQPASTQGAQPAQGQVSQPSAPPVLPTPRWDVAPGSLRTQLEHWAIRAHYQLIWKAQHDFDLEARAGFEGDFETAIKNLFAGLHRSGHALRVTLYRGNNVLEVAED
ncbi:hypothetical protein DVDV_0834 [Desulfovibrio sp. DV]|uniref:TcpQ domain-containing protein n=1 Tax=Desulfovibrio sp. DV TaxID=1844708 RepID=UPI00095EB424|nr:TcpQ domain-containing protein [Desulfovibrio sp. DV]OLN30039.1 hypothetical protein DVDV_0834 [Desulfovibrio sp. DV]